MINGRVDAFVYYLPTGEGLRFGQKIEPLLSPATTTSFDMALKRKYVTTVVHEVSIPRYLINSDHDGTVDSPGPGYREQRDVHLDRVGIPLTAPIMSNGSN